MKSITNRTSGSQGAEGGIRVYPFGIHIDGPTKGQSFPNRGGGGPDRKRGEITGFSAAARRRMRDAMLSRWIPGAYLVGVTFTVPWRGTNFQPLLDEFRACWHRFGIAFRRRFDHSAIIYRVELQQRGAPHIHALCWLHPLDAAAAMGAPVAPVVADGVYKAADGFFREMWVNSVKNLHRGSLRHFRKHGVKVEPIRNAGAMFRYLADHASKHKQAQLGYKGKQWGIVGEGNLERRDSVLLPSFDSFKHEAIFNRLLRKVMRYRLTIERHPKWWFKHPPPFGSVLKGSRRVVGDFYLRQDTALRMFEHARDLAACVPRGTIV